MMRTWQQAVYRAHHWPRVWAMWLGLREAFDVAETALWAIVLVLGIFCLGVFLVNCYRHVIGG